MELLLCETLNAIAPFAIEFLFVEASEGSQRCAKPGQKIIS